MVKDLKVDRDSVIYHAFLDSLTPWEIAGTDHSPIKMNRLFYEKLRLMFMNAQVKQDE